MSISSNSHSNNSHSKNTHSPNKGTKQFYIATNNLLNLALPNRVYYPNADPYSNSQYDKKIKGLGQLLRDASADIYTFQEVWDEDALKDLGKQLGFSESQVLAPGASNDIHSNLTQGKGATSTPSLGILSKFEVIDWQLLTDFDPLAITQIPDSGEYKAFNRPPLIATLNVHGQNIIVITAHLKSKRPHFLRDQSTGESAGNRLEDFDDPRVKVRAKLRSLYMRGAEAAALRLFIIDHLKNNHYPLILLGDMNDVTDSVTTQLLAETSEVAYDKGMRDIALFEAAKVQTAYGWTQNMAYTHLYQGMPEVIDQLFVSEEFLSDSKFSLGEVQRVDYFNDHLKRDYAQRYSDHGIVRALMQLN